MLLASEWIRMVIGAAGATAMGTAAIFALLALDGAEEGGLWKAAWIAVFGVCCLLAQSRRFVDWSE